MPGLADLQTRFIDFLSGKSGLITCSVAEQGNIDAGTRLNIYRNAYQIRLKQALETDHEMLGIYLGDELFELMATGYIAAHPSSFTSLRHFGDRLPEYLKQAEPFYAHPIASELAFFERRLLDVFDAPDSQRVPLSALREIPPGDWPNMKLRFHPSTRLFAAGWNSIESWKALPRNCRETHTGCCGAEMTCCPGFARSTRMNIFCFHLRSRAIHLLPCASPCCPAMMKTGQARSV